MTGKQTLVGVGGMGLILVNFWSSEARSVVSGGLFSPGGDTGAAHRTLAVMGGELLFVIVATVLAGISDGWGALMVATVVALFVLWAVHHYGSGTTQATTSSSSGPSLGIVKGVAA